MFKVIVEKEIREIIGSTKFAISFGEVAVADHRRLGHAGGARGIGEERRVVGPATKIASMRSTVCFSS